MIISNIQKTQNTTIKINSNDNHQMVMIKSQSLNSTNERYVYGKVTLDSQAFNPKLLLSVIRLTIM